MMEERLRFGGGRVEISIKKQGEALVVSVEGRIDTISAPDFQRRMEEMLQEGARAIVVDLERLEYISSAGLRSVLVAAQKCKQAGGRFCCCALQGMVKKVFDISGFHVIIPILETTEQALQKKE
jgi:anti-anti-sigma factor